MTTIDPDQEVRLKHDPASSGCGHGASVKVVKPSATGCEECLRDGMEWVHLRICMECGHVGCCDSSPRKHATRHYRQTGHPIIRSIEPREHWGWCYEDRVMISG